MTPIFTRVSIIIFFVVASTWHISASPATWFDEGINLGIASSLIRHGVYSLELGPNSFVPSIERSFLITTNYPTLIPVAASLYFLQSFDPGLGMARVPMVLYLWLFGFFLFRIIKRLSDNPWTPWLALALLATFAPLYGNGKAVLGEIPGLVFLCAGILTLPQSLNHKRLFGAGLLFGLSIAAKPYFLIVAPAVLVSELFFYWSHKKIFFSRIGIMTLGAVIPLFLWLMTIIQPFHWITILGAINYYANSYAVQSLWDSVGVNLLRFVSESTPIHFMLLFIPTIIVWIRRYQHKTITATEIILAVFILITFGWYLKTPGWYRYFFTAHVLLLALFPLSLSKIFSRKTAAIISVGLFAIQLVHVVSRTRDPLYNSDAATVFTTEMKQKKVPSGDVLVINSPSIAFLLRNQPEVRIHQILQINPDLHFGYASLKMLYDGGWYPYVITSGSLADTDLEQNYDVLEKEYEPIVVVEKYQLFKKRSL